MGHRQKIKPKTKISRRKLSVNFVLQGQAKSC